ncbi:hypothetical protein [uncultured Enorma sp.]|uniref:hypothetical protein n=1 Tax=uncultured Enorma sp. TaxID=1714346 RepID=UPI0025F22FA9|nr:hypothetical protein [uncultured Enorma sp.]
MKLSRIFAPAALAAAVFLAGCSGGAPAEGSAPAEATEQVSEPVMTNWQETSFYERPVSEVVSDLELLSSEMTGEEYLPEDEMGYSYLFVTLSGKPDEIPLADVGETVTVSFTIEAPQFEEGAEEQTVDTLAEDTMLTGVDIVMSHADVDSSEYEALAQQAVDAFGLSPMTSSDTGPSPFDETRMLGNYTGPAAFNGTDTEYLIVVSNSPEVTGDPDMPLYIDVNLFYVSAYA